MVRSLWLGAMVAGLVGIGLVWGQPSPPVQPGAAAPRERYVTVREAGRPPQRCKVLKTWQETDGATAYQVRAVDTGELMTLVETGRLPAPGDPKGLRARAVATRVFRWGRENKAPSGSPTPPPDSTDMGAPLASSVPQIRSSGMTGKPLSTPSKSATNYASNTTIVSAPILPQPFPTTPRAEPTSPTGAMPRPDNGATSAAAGMPIVIQGQNSTANGCASAQPRLTPMAGGVVNQTPCDPCGSPSPPCCCTPAKQRQSLLGRIFRPNPSTSAVASKSIPIPPPTPVVHAATEPAKPGDWRESWGKVEPWEGSAVVMNDKPVKRIVRDPSPEETPRQPDPLKDPDWYRGLALKEKQAIEAPSAMAPPAPPPMGEDAPAAKRKPDAPPVSVSSPSKRRASATQVPPEEGNAFWTPPPPAPPNAEQPPQYNAFGPRDGNAPPPMGSVPPMMGPPRGPMPMGPMGPMPMAAQPLRPVGPPALIDSGVPSGLANAFTVAGTRRPIPANFGPTPQEPNGFGDFDPSMVARGPAMPPQSAPPVGYPPRGPNVPAPPGMAFYPRPPMPAMLPREPMARINPLMSVPPSPAAPVAPIAAAQPASVPQLLGTLKDSVFPSQREWAAEQLSELNWHSQPHVVQSLTAAAKDDPAATVRAACVHALAHMKVNTVEVVTIVRDLKNDRDPRVRAEVDDALTTLGVAPAPRPDWDLQPASHK